MFSASSLGSEIGLVPSPNGNLSIQFFHLGNQPLTNSSDKLNSTAGTAFGATGGISYSISSSMLAQWDDLDTDKAFQVAPYQLVVYHKTKGVSGILSGEDRNGVFVFPAPPTSIIIDSPTAVNLSVTMKGIVEEHNDAPLKRITISGTSGVRPVAGFNVKNTGIIANLVKSALGNTIQAMQNTINQGASTINTFASALGLTDNQSFAGPAHTKFDGSDSDGTLDKNITGFQMIHSLDRFLSWYLAAKKSGGNGNDLRLVFEMYKDQMFYECTLAGYSINKAAGTLEYSYTINLTAWKRRPKPVGGKAPPTVSKSSVSDTNPFTRIASGLRQARSTLNSVNGIMKGISADFDTVVIGPLKQCMLLSSAYSNARQSIANFQKTTSVSLLLAAIATTVKGNDAKQKLKVESLNQYLSKKNTQGIPGSLALTSSSGLTALQQAAINAENSGKADSQFETTAPTTAPYNDFLKNPDDYDDLYDSYNVDEITVSRELRKKVNSEVQAAKKLTDSDILVMKTNLDNFSEKVSEAFGGGNTTFNRIAGLPTPKITNRTLSTDDINILNALNDASMQMDKLAIALRNSRNNNTNDYASFYASYARTQGIDFASNTSKFYVPFPHGASLESLAVQYLNDYGRWIEIAAINGLKPPYIDEDGFTVHLSASGSGSTIVTSSVDNLYIGQTISISSNTQQAELRQITVINTISAIEYIITLNGASDLSKFLVSEGAAIQAYLPNTVNSNMLIAIPSTIPVNIPGSIQVNPDSTDLTTIGYMAKADFMLQLSTTGIADLAFSGSDILIARGMQNLVQAANIKILTKQNELINDPTFGNPVSVGVSTATVDASKILGAISDSFADDSRFNGIAAGRVVITGGTALVSILLGVSGSKAYLPFTTMLPK